MPNKLTKAVLTATCLVFGASGALASGDGKAKIKEYTYDVDSAWTTLHVSSSDGAEWDTLNPGTLQFFGFMKIDTRWPGAVKQVGVVMGQCEGESCKLNPLLWSTNVNERDYLHQRYFSVSTDMIENGQTGTLLERQKILDTCNQHLSANGATKRHEFQHSLQTTFIADTDKRDLGKVLGQADSDTLTHLGEVDHSKSRPFTFNVVCHPAFQGTTSDLQFDHGTFKITDINLFLSTFSGGNTSPNPATVCKKGRVLVRLNASKAGPAKFKLWTKVGNGPLTSKVVDAWASHDGNGGFKAEYTEWVTVSNTTLVQAMAEEMVSSIGKTTQWKEITLPCTSPGGGGLASGDNHGDPVDDNLPQFKTLKGDFSFVDHGAPKCDRVGKALLTFTSPKPDNIHYSLDCKDDNHSGVVPVVPNPAGGYMAAKIVSFDVKKTYTESCTLRTVAPYGPKEHVSKIHLFQCVTPAVPSASNDEQAPSIPPWDKPVDPAPSVQTAPNRVVIGTGASTNPSLWWQCIGGSMKSTGCVCRAGWKAVPWTVKDHGVKRHGKKCVPAGPGNKTTVPNDPAINGLTVNPNSDAERRRQEAAKKAEEARRKRAQAAERARRLKAAQDAAIAKRKRDAALAKRKREAELARARLKAKQKAALKAQQRARRTNAAISTFSAPKRKKVRRKKRSAPKLTGSATQMRMIRRR